MRQWTGSGWIDERGVFWFGCVFRPVSYLGAVQTKLEHGWFFSPQGELRACVILTIGATRRVRDNETGLYVDVKPEDVLVSKPEPEQK